MTRNQFFDTLDRELSVLGYDERRGILQDYEEHFQIALQEGRSEEDIINDLGTPLSIAQAYKEHLSTDVSSSDTSKTELDRLSSPESSTDYEVAKTIHKTEIPNSNQTASQAASQAGVTFEAAKNDSINVSLHRANVELYSEEGLEEIKVEVFYHDKNEEHLHQYKVEIEKRGKTIYVYQNKRVFSFMFMIKIGKAPLVVIKVPKGFNVENAQIKTISGSIDVSGLVAYDAVLKTVSGSIKGTDIKTSSLKINNVSGKISLDRVFSEKLEVVSVSGAIIGDDIAAVSSAFKTVSGAIRVNGSSKRITTSAVSGSIAVNLNSEYEYINASTISGALSYNVPDNVSVQFKYSTMSGGVKCSFAEPPHGVKNGTLTYEAPSPITRATVDFSAISGSMQLMHV